MTKAISQVITCNLALSLEVTTGRRRLDAKQSWTALDLCVDHKMPPNYIVLLVSNVTGQTETAVLKLILNRITFFFKKKVFHNFNFSVIKTEVNTHFMLWNKH